MSYDVYKWSNPEADTSTRMVININTPAIACITYLAMDCQPLQDSQMELFAHIANSR